MGRGFSARELLRGVRQRKRDEEAREEAHRQLFEAGGSLELHLIEGAGVDKNHMFMLKGQEFTFDVELSTMPCGFNAALYLPPGQELQSVKSREDLNLPRGQGRSVCVVMLAK